MVSKQFDGRGLLARCDDPGWTRLDFASIQTVVVAFFNIQITLQLVSGWGVNSMGRLKGMLSVQPFFACGNGTGNGTSLVEMALGVPLPLGQGSRMRPEHKTK